MAFAVVLAAALVCCFALGSRSARLLVDRRLEESCCTWVAFLVPSTLALLSPWEADWLIQSLIFLILLAVCYGFGCQYGRYLREQEFKEGFQAS